jgi:hypothetical protein
MEIELLLLFILHTLGVSIFGKFESQTAWWKLTLKWLIVLGITAGLYRSFGHIGSLSFLAIMFTAGLIFHFTWCARHGIHPIHATPRRRYFELRKWKWQE